MSLGISFLKRYTVTLTNQHIIIRHGKNKETTILKADVRGIHVKDKETLLLMAGEELFSINHDCLKNSEKLIKALQSEFPAATPPANVLGQYKVADQQPDKHFADA
ncbi:hypothetical protein AB9P05_02200 [Roseivirga sp. BDSF3-8]|uniref:hypothetical protein n=1 Tax=Roseivirga sp. BDSF3-8 TaxID=3241598 RepID=UPI003532376F